MAKLDSGVMRSVKRLLSAGTNITTPNAISNSARWTNGYGIGSGRNSSTGSEARQDDVMELLDFWGLRNMWHDVWRRTRDAGGAIVMATSNGCLASRTSIVLASPASHDLNFLNRPVRTRMPGGVRGAAIMAAPYADCRPVTGSGYR